MKAKLIEHQAPGGKRTPLEANLPLSTPYVLQFFPIYACNFTCSYCHFSIPRTQREFVTDQVIMDYDLFEKCIKDIGEFPEKIRTLRFVGMGEPLMHKQLPDMISYAKKMEVAERVEVLTNGSLLTKELSDAIIASGLDRLVISLQGTRREKYEEVSKFALDFEQFVENIKYFYEHKKSTHVYIKVVDVALEDENDKERFFTVFGDICDSIGIETAVPIFPGVDYSDVLGEGKNVTQFGLDVVNSPICPQPFFSLQINPDGKVVGCYSVYYPEILGDCNNESVQDIWNGVKYNDFRRRMLDGRGNVCRVCKECNIMNYRMFPEDQITNEIERLKQDYGR